MAPLQGDQGLHDAVRTAVMDGLVELKTDGLHLYKPGSPVYAAWDHLLPLLGLMLASLGVLLAAGLAFGLATMTVAMLAYIFGMRWWVCRQVHRRALDVALRNAYNWIMLWNYGGVAVIHRSGLERPCIAPDGDWREFAQRLSGIPSAEDSNARERPAS